MKIVLGIGEHAVSDNEEDVLKTFSLGSCVALTIYSRKRRVLGMVHIALPSSEINKANSQQRPGYYADTAILELLNVMLNQYRCKKHELVASIYGGAYSIKHGDHFRVNEKNVSAVKSILAKYFIYLQNEETGGTCIRNVEADVATGTIKLGRYSQQG